jgi:hypothetical protein
VDPWPALVMVGASGWQPITLSGWSLGGRPVREMARIGSLGVSPTLRGFATARRTALRSVNRPGVVGDFWPWRQGRSYAYRSWCWEVSESAVFG